MFGAEVNVLRQLVCPHRSSPLPLQGGAIATPLLNALVETIGDDSLSVFDLCDESIWLLYVVAA